MSEKIKKKTIKFENVWNGVYHWALLFFLVQISSQFLAYYLDFINYTYSVLWAIVFLFIVLLDKVEVVIYE